MDLYYVYIICNSCNPYHYRRKFKFLHHFDKARVSALYGRQTYNMDLKQGTKLDFSPHEGSVETLHAVLAFKTDFSV